MKKKYDKVCLIILDGFGHGKAYKGNAITQAKMAFTKNLWEKYPTTLLKASGNDVGQPKGFQGNSEVGHFTMGAGRIVWQSLEEINRTIRDKTFFKKKEFLDAIENVKKHHSRLHLLGMISNEGVHAQIDHLFALLKLAHDHTIQKVSIHAITDGRDVPEKSAKKFIHQIQTAIKKYKTGEIVSIIGRYFAMDRDNNWDRTLKAFELFTQGKGTREHDPIKAIEHAYQKGDATDYYLRPMMLDPKGIIRDKDSVIFFNYRTDRSRQLTECFVKRPSIHFVCMGPYSKTAPVAFKNQHIPNNLGSVIDQLGLKQLRIAETEKYAHVTFFFNSQKKDPFPSETRILIDSPKVPSYDLKPEMSAPKLTETFLKEIDKNYHLIVLNFANTDLVAHSANLKATIECCEVIDHCLKKIIPLAIKKGYHIILTADHGNAEMMIYPDGTPCPSHTINRVPCTLISKKYSHLKKEGGLKDIAPTILKLMGIPKPKEMTGVTLTKTP